MKKIIFSILLIFSVVALVACSSTTPTKTTPQTQFPSSTQDLQDGQLSATISPVYGTELRGTATLQITQVPENTVNVVVLLTPTSGTIDDVFDSPKTIAKILSAEPQSMQLNTGALPEGQYRLQIIASGAGDESTIALSESYYQVK
ncbi:MAG: hypothetical protein ACOCQQ_00360 [Candidatus Nanoarchaeia archaeon]